jgi:hypothetical protein
MHTGLGRRSPTLGISPVIQRQDRDAGRTEVAQHLGDAAHRLDVAVKPDQRRRALAGRRRRRGREIPPAERHGVRCLDRHDLPVGDPELGGGGEPPTPPGEGDAVLESPGQEDHDGVGHDQQRDPAQGEGEEASAARHGDA